MSSSELRNTASRVAAPPLSLKARLESAGITVLDDTCVATMMRAVLYGLHPNTPSEIVEKLDNTGALLKYPEWTIFDYDVFMGDTDIMQEYGGWPPDQIRDKVDRIRKHLPRIAVAVCAVPEDPFIRVSDEDDHCWVAAYTHRSGVCIF